ncbi:hypothetical protein Pla100_43970 [Neorhodopirellula pilleata]|uniref:Uncharacterized protein n=1 Tax=Neorhodopirellula pilleata TaxID=2714738 RepID=A0A5C6A192_9BACT|nr:hypothetical protein Pla100_43970 [Neorhodopirellula pilleata]
MSSVLDIRGEDQSDQIGWNRDAIGSAILAVICIPSQRSSEVFSQKQHPLFRLAKKIDRPWARIYPRPPEKVRTCRSCGFATVNRLF